jgi:murein L,D-transpeptidase YafK
VSYPAPADVRKAARLGVAPGGQIMIHGQPNKPKHNEEYYRRTDWTDGCIAVSNSDMVDIWLMTTPSTPITIRP